MLNKDIFNRIADFILTTDKLNVEAILIKADSLFNLCFFERALVTYHR